MHYIYTCFIYVHGVDNPPDGCIHITLQWICEEDMYIEQPEGFEAFYREWHVLRLKRALYGLNNHPILGTL